MDESAEQLKEATEVTFSKKTCAKLFALILNSNNLKCYYTMLLDFFFDIKHSLTDLASKSMVEFNLTLNYFFFFLFQENEYTK